MEVTNLEALARVLAIAPLIPRDPVRIEEFAARYMLEEREVIECMEFLAGSDLAELAAAYDYDSEDLEGGRIRRRSAGRGLPPLPITRDEAVVLLVVGRALADAGILGKGTDLVRLLEDRQALFDGRDEQYVRDLASRIIVHLGTDPGSLSVRIQKAVMTGRVIRMTYYSYSRDTMTEREVEPIRLVVSRGIWYMLAWCRNVDGYRYFRLDRIKKMEVTRKRFERDPSAHPPAPEFIGEKGGKHRVRLSLPDRVRWSIAEDWNDARFLPGPRAGWFSVELRTGNLEWLARYLLKFGSDVRVESPAELRGMIERLATAMLESYGPAGNRPKQ